MQYMWSLLVLCIGYTFYWPPLMKIVGSPLLNTHTHIPEPKNPLSAEDLHGFHWRLTISTSAEIQMADMTGITAGQQNQDSRLSIVD